MIGYLLMTVLLAPQYSAPEGADGLVYKKDWATLRLATQRKGKWDTWRMYARPGNGGQVVPLSAAEAVQVEGHLREIAQVVESTPYAQAQRGWYASRSVAWIRTRFPTALFALGKLPVRSYYSLYPFHLMDALTTRNGVQQWFPEWSQETIPIEYSVNGTIPGPARGAVYQEDIPGDPVQWYAGEEPDGSFHGFPVYGGEVVIARKGRALFKKVSLTRAVEKFLPLYQVDVKTAEERLRAHQQRLAETNSTAFAQEALSAFEREYGSWKTTRPADYEFRRKTRLEWVDRMRNEAREQATPREGTAEGNWYWEPKRALEAVERLANQGGGNQAACFEATPPGTALYRAKGHIRAAVGGGNCKPLMEPDPEYFDAALPRTAPQLIRIGRVDRCIDLKSGAPTDRAAESMIPHGCTVHRALWAEMDWLKLAAILAP